ncbi:unnamed protein product [Ectocarpus sp. 12 AP-2014]
MQPHTRATSRRYLLVLMDELYPCLRLRTKGEQFNAIPQFVPPIATNHLLVGNMFTCTRTKHIKYLPARTQAPCVLSGAMPKRTACQRVGGGPGHQMGDFFNVHILPTPHVQFMFFAADTLC